MEGKMQEGRVVINRVIENKSEGVSGRGIINST